MESKNSKTDFNSYGCFNKFLGSNLVYADVVQSNSNNRASTETARVTGNNLEKLITKDKEIDKEMTYLSDMDWSSATHGDIDKTKTVQKMLHLQQEIKESILRFHCSLLMIKLNILIKE